MTEQERRNIRSLSIEELAAWFLKKGEDAYRAKQVFEWLWKRNINQFTEMTNLPVQLREELSADFTLNSMENSDIRKSTDGTVKFGFRFSGNTFAEGVLIPDHDRYTACISSQAGCSLNCRFCATGKLKLKRNLTMDEIYRQVFFINEYCLKNFSTRLDNIVLMGMGEPLLNYKNVTGAIEMVASNKGLAMSPQRITLSTAGISKMIQKLADDRVRFNLALSLHAATDEKRSAIMPINETNNLHSLSQAVKYFHSSTGTRISYEYIMLKDFNDSPSDARTLASFCRVSPCKINLIEYNPVAGSLFEKSETEKVQQFISILRSRNLLVYFRKSRGRDIEAACGQLAGLRTGGQQGFGRQST